MQGADVGYTSEGHVVSIRDKKTQEVITSFNDPDAGIGLPLPI